MLWSRFAFENDAANLLDAYPKDKTILNPIAQVTAKAVDSIANLSP